MSGFRTLFPDPRPLIGVIATTPSPGYPEFTGIGPMIETALADLATLERGGITAVLVENDFDRPHTLTAGPEVIAAMTAVTREVRAAATVPVGVQVLLDDWRASLAIASSTGARFIRLDFFVDRVRIGAGVIDPDPVAVLDYRRAIGADQVLIFADIQVKYSTLVDGPKPLERSAREAAAAGADAVVVTGAETGIGPDPADLEAARAGGIPVLIGSGLAADNAALLAPLSDGAIVGTSFRNGRTWTDRPVVEKVSRLVRAVRHLGRSSG